MDYIRRFDPNFSWKIVKEVDQTIKAKEGRVMPPLQISLDEAKQEGWKLGQIDGIKKGRQEGRQEGQKELIFNMLKKQADIAFISEVTGLSQTEIKNLKNGS